MYSIAHERDLTGPDSRTATFEGMGLGSGISFFHVDNEPGEGPALHTHPYSETFLVLAGDVAFTAGDEVIDAQAGNIVTVESGTPHAFRNTGVVRLEMVCIHDSPEFITQWLDDGAAVSA